MSGLKVLFLKDIPYLSQHCIYVEWFGDVSQCPIVQGPHSGFERGIAGNVGYPTMSDTAVKFRHFSSL